MRRWNAASIHFYNVAACGKVFLFFESTNARLRLTDCVSRSTNEAISLSRNQKPDCVFEFVATMMINRLCAMRAMGKKNKLLIEKNFRGE